MGSQDIESYGSKLRTYWRESLKDLWHNLALGWPIFAILVAWLAISTLVLYYYESQPPSWGKALYLTIITMTTVGNVAPSTAIGQVMAAADAIMGVVLLGVVVWLLTASLSRR